MNTSPLDRPWIETNPDSPPKPSPAEACRSKIVLAIDALQRALSGVLGSTQPNWDYVYEQVCRAQAELDWARLTSVRSISEASNDDDAIFDEDTALMPTLPIVDSPLNSAEAEGGAS